MTAAVILAAGTSRRFGRGAKLLVRARGRTLIARSVARVLAVSSGPVILVSGARAHALIAAVRRDLGTWPRRLHVAYNANYRSGMGTSLAHGLLALPGRPGRVLVCLADMPNIDEALIRQLKRQWRASVFVARPVHAGRPGHPVMLSADLFADIGRISGDNGAHDVIKRLPSARCRTFDWPRVCIDDNDTRKAMRMRSRRC